MLWLRTALIGALAIAAVSTFGDFVWATWIPRHRMIYGLTHGAVLFLAIGLFLGQLARRAAAGAMFGTLIGLLAAGSYYVLVPLFRGLGLIAIVLVMVAAWIGAWIALDALHGYLQRRHRALGTVVVRGVVASIVCGAAFYAVSGIWFPFRPRGLDYLWHYGAWTLAFLPGFATLLFPERSMAARVTQEAQ
jgi:hypothetical protein